MSPRLTTAAENMSVSDMDGERQSSNERKRMWLPIYQMVPNGESSISIVMSSRFGFDNGCRCKCTCSLVVMHMVYLLGMRRYIPPPRLTVDAFTLSQFNNNVCGDGAVRK